MLRRFHDLDCNNTGTTFGYAVTAWRALDARYDDPSSRREIAGCNNYFAYLRDLQDAYPELTLEQAKTCWDAKKIRPAPSGTVHYVPEDLRSLT